ncbi:MAG: RHS repeat-associated core domain-containing protein [Rhodospirillales bacterium]|nr:RHS repeat-associated core domain-containing protein [Rhodospirillales bacterium]
MTNASGTVTNVNKYDEYGVPASGNLGLFQYTGQKWIAESGLYDYKARAYSPLLASFLEPDPIGYADGMNIYAYVGGDPINARDPYGLRAKGGCTEVIPGGENGCNNFVNPLGDPGGALLFSGGSLGGGAAGISEESFSTPDESKEPVDEIVVTGQPRNTSYLDGLVSTGFAPCDGICLPTVDYYFDEFGVTIVAERADRLSNCARKLHTTGRRQTHSVISIGSKKELQRYLFVQP